MTELALVVLGAGQGTRMKSSQPKVLHKIAGRSMLSHVLHAGRQLNAAKAIVIHGHDMDAVKTEAAKAFPNCDFAEQKERLGTGHAVMMAAPALQHFDGNVLVLYGDVPLIQAETLKALLAKLDAKYKMAVLGFEAAIPGGFGRFPIFFLEINHQLAT